MFYLRNRFEVFKLFQFLSSKTVVKQSSLCYALKVKTVDPSLCLSLNFRNLRLESRLYHDTSDRTRNSNAVGSTYNEEDDNVEEYHCEESDDEEESEHMAAYEELVQRTFRSTESGHQVFVIQPYIKWGPDKNHLTKPNYQLNESVSLIETLDNWKVVDQEKIPLTTFKRIKLFGKGNLESLKERIGGNKLISAVFVSVNMLSRAQQEFLEETFCVPVYDRYNIVIQIFHKHAVTKEAKLQVAMAEIPFMWYRIKSTDDKGGGGVSSIGGSGETYLELKKRLLTEKEQKIKKALKNLKIHREVLRNKRKKKEYPVIAVVGYTNAGKTSLIKALTEEERLVPKNKLFATLDVTVHNGLLPSNIKVLYVDTIGFISDIPTELIEPFTVTLEDALQADLLIHVMDISNPDVIAQCKHILDTFNRLKLNDNLLNNIINVGNKCDLVNDNIMDTLCSDDTSQFNQDIYGIMKDIIKVSSVDKTGLNILRMKIETALLKTTGRIPIKIRVQCGGDEFKWLYKESSIINVISDESNTQFVFIDVIITETNLMKFKHIFINSKINKRKNR